MVSRLFVRILIVIAATNVINHAVYNIIIQVASTISIVRFAEGVKMEDGREHSRVRNRVHNRVHNLHEDEVTSNTRPKKRRKLNNENDCKLPACETHSTIHSATRSGTNSASNGVTHSALQV